MGDQLVYNKSAVLEMDKNPAYKDPGETWGKNKLSFVDWDHLEEGTACLMEAAVGSQLLEGDRVPDVASGDPHRLPLDGLLFAEPGSLLPESGRGRV